MGIEGKIANILNTRELVINRGFDDEVTIDMEFAVLETRLSIIDPDTQEYLGDLEREKIRVRVFETHPKFSLARTYETYQEINPASVLPRLTDTFSPFVTKVKRLNTQTTSVDQVGIANVLIGDVVIEVSVLKPPNND
jgi:hypothetical protein